MVRVFQRIINPLLLASTFFSLGAIIALIVVLVNRLILTSYNQTAVEAVGILGVVTLGIQLTVIGILLFAWFHYNAMLKSGHELALLGISLIPGGPVLILLLVMIAYVQRSTKQLSPEGKQGLRDIAVGSTIDVLQQSPGTTSAPSASRIQDAIERVLGPSTKEMLSRTPSALLPIAVIATTLALLVSATVALNPYAPLISEFTVPTANSQPHEIVLGSDGALWFTEANGTKIGRITTTGTSTEPAALTATSDAITRGPDGALWVTQINGDLEHVTTGGKVTEITPTTANSDPIGITTGPDGAIWFTEWTARNIGRMTTAGNVTNEYTVPTALGQPTLITTGPDGALWFTEQGGNSIGRITTTGKIHPYPLHADSLLWGITVGPDGALWFTDYGKNKIGRITTSGHVNEFPIPTANSKPQNIISGPDGALWFTEFAGNKIGRITTDGTVTEYTIPTANSSPYGITNGPNGAIWFTEFTGEKIGRIVP